ncbi:hypothetical protein ABBQ38_010148 [Trebouxia sp. C0009 RCD-2024]
MAPTQNKVVVYHQPGDSSVLQIPGGDIAGVVTETGNGSKAMSDWDIKPESRVLVHAGSSGVGTWVLQTAKLRGAHVVATAGPKNQEFLKELGADETLNYREEDFAEVYKDKPFDFIFDSVGGDATVKGYTKLIKKSGAYTEIANAGTDEKRCKE